MSNLIAKRLNLILQKGQNTHIVICLLYNRILLWKLKIWKLLHGVKHPIVHYYALCWNEEKMLPFMFDYYDQFVDQYTIYDNYSTDGSEEIIRSHENAEIIKFSMDGEINDLIYQQIKNNCWKKSRGKADYVVVCDMDEFIFHQDIRGFLMKSYRNKNSFFYPSGYEMYCENYPKYQSGNLLTKIVTTGVPSKKYGKSIIFDPHRIVEVNYEPGAHEVYPLGIVKVGRDAGLKMLHYKNLDIEEVVRKTKINGEKLSQGNKDKDLGTEYLRSEADVRSVFTQCMTNAIEVI